MLSVEFCAANDMMKLLHETIGKQPRFGDLNQYGESRCMQYASKTHPEPNAVAKSFKVLEDLQAFSEP